MRKLGFIILILGIGLFLLSIISNPKDLTYCEAQMVTKCYGANLDGYCIGYYHRYCMLDDSFLQGVDEQ
jgi:hypothetical protein